MFAMCKTFKMALSLVLVIGLSMAACSEKEHDGDRIILNVNRGAFQISRTYAILADGTGEAKNRLPKNLGDEVELSPNGAWVAFNTKRYSDEAPNVFIMKIGSNDPIRVTPQDLSGYEPAWSPDGQQLAFTGEGFSIGEEIRIVDIACLLKGEKCEPESIVLAWGSSPDWSSDGMQIAYQLDGDIMVMDVDGKRSPRNLTPTLGRCYPPPAWSPDGKKIAFSCYEQNHEQSCCEQNHGRNIFVVNSDGSDIQQLSTGLYNKMPQWSPDGNRIAFVSDRDGLGDAFTLMDSVFSNAVFVMNADGANVVRLSLRDNEEVFWFTWFPGSLIFDP